MRDLLSMPRLLGLDLPQAGAIMARASGVAAKPIRVHVVLGGVRIDLYRRRSNER
jgi:hypothetical protein